MKFNRSIPAVFAAAGFALAALAVAPAAQARSNVFFSVGAQVAPGVSIGLSNAPVVYAPQPVYYSAPPVVYSPPVYVEPAPVYYPGYYPRVVYRPAYYPGHRGHGHWR